MEPSVDEQIFRTELLIRAGDRYKYRTVSLASQGHRVECRHSSEGLYRSRKKTYLTPETGRDPDTPSDMMQWKENVARSMNTENDDVNDNEDVNETLID